MHNMLISGKKRILKYQMQGSKKKVTIQSRYLQKLNVNSNPVTAALAESDQKVNTSGKGENNPIITKATGFLSADYKGDENILCAGTHSKNNQQCAVKSSETYSVDDNLLLLHAQVMQMKFLHDKSVFSFDSQKKQADVNPRYSN